MREVNYRNVRSTPPRLTKLSQLENDLNILTTEEVDRRLEELEIPSVKE